MHLLFDLWVGEIRVIMNIGVRPVVERRFLLLPVHAAGYRWKSPVLHYHEIMVIYPYPFLVVITQLFS